MRRADEQVTVTGCLATPHDVFGDEVMLPHAEPGDLIAIFAAGAYGLTRQPAGLGKRGRRRARTARLGVDSLDEVEPVRAAH